VVKNIFITGAPSSGKTTVIKKVISELTLPASGFYTEEEKIDGRRSGFIMKTLDGKSGYLGHEKIKSEYFIRRYGVSIENIENIAVPSIYPVKNNIIILDEIGSMECFSDKFQTAALKALDSENIVIGTITLGSTDFIDKVKSRKDIEIMKLTRENRNDLPDRIIVKINELLEFFSEPVPEDDSRHV